MAYIMTQSTISNDVGVGAAYSYFHKGSVNQLLNDGSYLEQLLGLKNSQSCVGNGNIFFLSERGRG